MDIKELKQSIEDKNLHIGFLIFKYVDNNFLPNQYIHEISKILNLDITYLDDLDTIVQLNNDIFGWGNMDISFNIFNVDLFNNTNEKLLRQTNLIVICKKLSKECEELFKDNIIEFPKLEKWQIQDYVYSIAEGIDTKKLDELIELCKWDIYKIEQELNKIRLFNVNERKYIYSDFLNDGIFSDLSTHNIFDLSNAVLKKDINSLTSLYKEIEKIDCEPLGLVTTLYQALKNIISIQLSPNASPESTGLPANRFWAIKKNNCGFYNKEQLLNSFYLITDLDRKLKIGDITVDIMIDYIVCHMLSF